MSESSNTSSSARVYNPVTYQTLFESERQKSLLLTIVSIVLAFLFVVSSTFAIVSLAQRRIPMMGGGQRISERLEDRQKDGGMQQRPGGMQGGMQGPGQIGGQRDGAQKPLLQNAPKPDSQNKPPVQ